MQTAVTYRKLLQFSLCSLLLFPSLPTCPASFFLELLKWEISFWRWKDLKVLPPLANVIWKKGGWFTGSAVQLSLGPGIFLSLILFLCHCSWALQEANAAGEGGQLEEAKPSVAEPHMNGNAEMYFMSLSWIFRVSIVQSCTVQALWPNLKVSAYFLSSLLLVKLKW